MKAAIIGVNGYLGRNLAYAMSELNWDIVGYGTKEESLVDGLKYSKADICSQEDVERIDTEVDFIFFFASKTGTFQAYEDYTGFIGINEVGLLNVLSLIRRRGAGCRVVFPSTRLVYKGQQGKPLKEVDPKEFKSIYALTKFFGEQSLQQYQSYFGIPFTVFRICVPFGDMSNSGYSYGTVGFFLNMARQGKNISLYGDGLLSRTFSHTYDISMQMLKSLEKPESINEVFNISGETFSLKDVAELIALKYNVGVTHAAWPERDALIESGDTIFDGSKLEEICGYKSKFKFSEWLKTVE
jgi:UDP-glucose 4-epimerase